MSRWTRDEMAILREIYPKEGARGVMARIGRNEKQVKSQAERFGIRTTVFMDSIVERKRAILEFMRQQGECTRREIEKAFSLSRGMVELALSDLSNAGVIIYSNHLKSWIFTGEEGYPPVPAPAKASRSNSTEDRCADRAVKRRVYRAINDSKAITADDLEWMRTWGSRAAEKRDARQRYLDQKSAENQFC